MQKSVLWQHISRINIPIHVNILETASLGLNLSQSLSQVGSCFFNKVTNFRVHKMFDGKLLYYLNNILFDLGDFWKRCKQND